MIIDIKVFNTQILTQNVPEYKTPECKLTKMCLKMSISSGLIFEILRYLYPIALQNNKLYNYQAFGNSTD